MLGNDAMEFLKTLHELDNIWSEVEDAEYNDRQLTQFAERYHEHKLKLLGIHDVSKSMPIKYDIDFGGNVLAGIEISENTPKVFGAINGYGNGISIENIKITKR